MREIRIETDLVPVLALSGGSWYRAHKVGRVQERTRSDPERDRAVSTRRMSPPPLQSSERRVGTGVSTHDQFDTLFVLTYTTSLAATKEVSKIRMCIC